MGSFRVFGQRGNLRRRRILRSQILVLLRLFWFVRGGVQRDKSIEGIGDSDGSSHRNLFFALLHPYVTLHQQQLGLGIIPLAKQRPAEQRHRGKQKGNKRTGNKETKGQA